MRVSQRVMLLAALGVVLSACHGCENRLFGPKLSSTSRAGHDVWEARMDYGAGVVPSATVVDGVVVVGDGFSSTSLIGLDEKTGKTKWRTALGDNGAGPAVAFDDSVAFTTESCTLYVADAKSGAIRWSKWLGDPLVSHPAFASHVVYLVAPKDVSSNDHALFAFDAADGHERWHVPVATDAIGAPIVAGDRVYVATQDGTLARFSTTGEEVWTVAAGTISAPVIDDKGDLFVVSRRRIGETFVEEVQRVKESASGKDAPTLSAPWHRRPSRIVTAIGESDELVAYGRFARAQHHLGTTSSDALWSWQGGHPFVANGRLYAIVGDELAAFDATNGAMLWTVPLADPEHTAPPVAKGAQVYLATAAGTLEARDAITGRLEETIPLDSQAKFPPVVDGDRIIVSTVDGRVLSIATHKGPTANQ